jgi:hypothetical protein
MGEGVKGRVRWVRGRGGIQKCEVRVWGENQKRKGNRRKKKKQRDEEHSNVRTEDKDSC